ncbi:MAG: hypothetical protein JST21_06630 [Bacteroidetes bacterium]|nr:hypothetical protein [Bacteroidota bacterium]
MKQTNFSIFILISVVIAACSKESRVTQMKAMDASNLMNAIDTAIVPLNDLGKNTFMGYVGGLYPGGRNNPPNGAYASDLLKVCKNISPLDTFGNISANGKIVFISLGGSTGGHNMKQLKDQTEGNLQTNPSLLLLKCNNGKRSASLISQMDPNDPYWDHVTQILTGGAHSSYRQVQIIYLESDDSGKNNISFPLRALDAKADLQACFKVYKQKFPNLKLVYLLGRTKTFGNQILYNREPAPYYFGWACKWAIEDQINGVPGTEYKGKKAVSPMITWGWYQWADTFPRKTDGFKWLASDTKDGLHATPVGQDTLATRFQNFLLTDRFAKHWYANPDSLNKN